MKIGFIGTGNMAGAIIGGLLNTKTVKPGDLFVSDASPKALENIQSQFPGIQTSGSNLDILNDLDFLYLSVKPHIYKSVITEIRDSLPEKTVVITIAAGKTRAQVEGIFRRPVKLVRTMPNTPALVGEGMCAICPGDSLSEKEVATVMTLWNAVGRAEIFEERLFDAYTALCGSGPAYVFMFIEALADAAVREGLPRDKSYVMAAQTVLGSAKMVLETGLHPGTLKDQVCSPGGTTIEAVGVLEEKGFRSAVMEAVRSCTQKSIKMSKD